MISRKGFDSGIHARKGAEQQWRDSLQHPDDHHLKCRTGEIVDKKQEGQPSQTVADFGNHLA